MINLPLVTFNPKDRTPNAPTYGISTKVIPFFRCPCAQWFDFNRLTPKGFSQHQSIETVQHAGCRFSSRVRLLDFPE